MRSRTTFSASRFFIASVFCFTGVFLVAGGASRADEISYSRDIRPILSDACFACHGPDEDSRAAGLRLDGRESATEDLGGYQAILPGDAGQSEIIRRVLSDDPQLVMPPPESGKSLDSQQIALLKRWIDQGAEYQSHWAFESPRSSTPPAAAEPTWDKHFIDRFVYHQMRRHGLSPNLPAGRETLIRRLTIDLTGLPPTPDEIDDYLNDTSSGATERLIDRLLWSPHFGERWGRVWLDAARYADSDGYEKDKPRNAYFYRDWVAAAFADDMPYDQFIIRQIAGDLLPDATEEDRIATGFLRNSMLNEEGGADPEQFRMEAMFDRMDAIGKSILGLTIQCAQCHSHKYDPLSHTDYYRMLAMLNQCHESSITVYDDEDDLQRVRVLAELADVYQRVRDHEAGWGQAALDWQAASIKNENGQWVIPELVWDATSISGQKYIRQEDGSYLQQSYAATLTNPYAKIQMDASEIGGGSLGSLRLELQRDPNLPHGGPGRSIDGTWALSELVLEVSHDSGKTYQKVQIETAVSSVNPPRRRLESRYHLKKPNPKRVTGPVEMAFDGDDNTAWTGTLSNGQRNDPQRGYFVFREPVDPDSDGQFRLKLTLKQRHGGWNSDDNQSQNMGRLRVAFSAKRDTFNPLPPGATLRPDLGTVSDQVLDRWLRSHTDLPGVAETLQEVDALWAEHPRGASQLVVSRRDRPRMTHRLDRGDFMTPKERVDAGTPQFLHPLPEDLNADRLALARWLVDRRSPTTARSIVNRIWQEYFGVGLVATPDDLGLQSAPPSHPELLDTLAVGLMENAWSLKWLHRTIVTSQTYQQSAFVDVDKRSADPINRWLARGARFRVSAETVRDLVLAASGLLERRIGGAPVHPPAPSFLFTPPASYGPKTWQTDTGAERYRRSFYVFRFRSVPFPAFAAFDAPTGEVSCVSRSRSNTPLQALVTLNEPVFLEAAIHLGKAIAEMNSGSADDLEKIHSLFRRCIGRYPNERETERLSDYLDQQRRRYSDDPASARSLVRAGNPAALSVDDPDSDGDGNVTDVEIAAWASLARVVLNLDEMVTRP